MGDLNYLVSCSVRLSQVHQLSLNLISFSFFLSLYSANYNADAGHKRFLQDCFMNESRVFSGNFGGSTIPYTNLQGDQIEDRDNTTVPEGWKWVDDWTIDLNRACDEEGWEYCIEVGLLYSFFLLPPSNISLSIYCV